MIVPLICAAVLFTPGSRATPAQRPDGDGLDSGRVPLRASSAWPFRVFGTPDCTFRRMGCSLPCYARS